MNTKALTARQIERRRRILDATRDQLAEGGYEGLNMRDLAVVADVSPTTLYNLFQNKDILILSALRDLLEQLAMQAAEGGKQGIERLLLRAEIFGQQIVDTPRYAEAMTMMLYHAGPDDPITELLLKLPIQDAKERLGEMQSAGEIRPEADMNLIANNLGTCGWSVIMLWLKGIVSSAEFRNEYVRATVAALAPAMTQAAIKAHGHLLQTSRA